MPIEHDDIVGDPSKPWVRMTSFEGAPEAVDRALQQVSEQLVPALRISEGWRRVVGLRSFDGRQGLVLSFWENHAALLGSEVTVLEVRRRAASVGLETDIDRLEVLFDEQ